MNLYKKMILTSAFLLASGTIISSPDATITLINATKNTQSYIIKYDPEWRINQFIAATSVQLALQGVQLDEKKIIFAGRTLSGGSFGDPNTTIFKSLSLSKDTLLFFPK